MSGGAHYKGVPAGMPETRPPGTPSWAVALVAINAAEAAAVAWLAVGRRRGSLGGVKPG